MEVFYGKSQEICARAGRRKVSQSSGGKHPAHTNRQLQCLSEKLKIHLWKKPLQFWCPWTSQHCPGWILLLRFLSDAIPGGVNALLHITRHSWFKLNYPGCIVVKLPLGHWKISLNTQFLQIPMATWPSRDETSPKSCPNKNQQLVSRRNGNGRIWNLEVSRRNGTGKAQRAPARPFCSLLQLHCMYVLVR